SPGDARLEGVIFLLPRPEPPQVECLPFPADHIESEVDRAVVVGRRDLLRPAHAVLQSRWCPVTSRCVLPIRLPRGENMSCARFAKYRSTHSAARRIQECGSLRTTVSGPE